jgi:hypothetical protein
MSVISGHGDVSMLSIHDLAVSVLIACFILFRSYIDCSHGSITALWHLIEYTCRFVSNLDAAYSYGASTLKFGTPRPP